MLGAASSLIPIPGVDLATDLAMMNHLIGRINTHFGLTEAQIRQLSSPQQALLLRLLAGAGGTLALRLTTPALLARILRLAGLRLGFGVMPAWLADYLLRVRLPFSVNLLAEAAGLAALEDADFIGASLSTVRRGRSLLAEKLTGLGCRVYPSQANFLMFKPPYPALEMFEGLLSRGIIVRALKSYGLPELLRVSIGSDEENAAFLAAFKDMLDHVV